MAQALSRPQSDHAPYHPSHCQTTTNLPLLNHLHAPLASPTRLYLYSYHCPTPSTIIVQYERILPVAITLSQLISTKTFFNFLLIIKYQYSNVPSMLSEVPSEHKISIKKRKKEKKDSTSWNPPSSNLVFWILFECLRASCPGYPVLAGAYLWW